MIFVGMFVIDECCWVVDFLEMVYSYGDVMFVVVDDSINYIFDGLKGEIVGVQIGIIFVDQLKVFGIFGEVKFYDSLVDIMCDVKLGCIKVGFGDVLIIVY